MQLHAEVVDDLLILAHSHGSTAVADGLEDLRLDPRLQRDWRVHVPLVVLGPLARGDQDDQLGQRVADGRLEAQVIAHRSRRVHQLGAAHQDLERTKDGNLAQRQELGRCLLLGVVVLLRRDRRQSVLRGGGGYLQQGCGDQGGQSPRQRFGHGSSSASGEAAAGQATRDLKSDPHPIRQPSRGADKWQREGDAG